MKITILLFAGLVDKFGKKVLEVELPSHKSIQAEQLLHYLMVTYPAHTNTLKRCFWAKNKQYAANGESFVETDEIALIPPVSGGEDMYSLTYEPLKPDEVSAKVHHPNHGASLVFIGTSREYTNGQRTLHLEYEAYTPMALNSLHQIGEEVSARWPGTRCAITHRLGQVGIGEASVVIAVSSAHREACYQASQYAIERLKQFVPIWKKEIWEDGSEWKGDASGAWNPVDNGRE